MNGQISCGLGVVFSQDYTGVMPTKTKGIAHDHLDVSLLSFIKRQVKAWIYVLINYAMVDSRRNNAVLNGEHRSDGLDSSGGTK